MEKSKRSELSRTEFLGLSIEAALEEVETSIFFEKKKINTLGIRIAFKASVEGFFSNSLLIQLKWSALTVMVKFGKLKAPFLVS